MNNNESVVVAEYRLLNALSKDKLYRNDSRIHEDLFIHETAKSVYQAILELDKNNIDVTKASLLQAGNEIDYNVNSGIIDAIFEVEEKAPSKLNDILEKLDKTKKTVLINDKLKELLEKNSRRQGVDQDELLQDIFELDSIIKTGSSISLLKSFGQWSDEYIEELKERSTGRRYTYGDELLDGLIRKGAYPGAITTIAASTGQGKSAFVLNLISNMINLEVPCMYISLEMSGTDTYDRLISLRRGIPMEDLYSYNTDLLSVIEIVEQEKEELKNNKNFYFVEEPDLSIARLRSLIKEFKQRSQQEYVFVAVDLITQVKDFMNARGGKSVANSYEEAMNSLNMIAKSENVHILGVAQFNRNADSYRIDSIEDLDLLRPTLNDIKNSHAIAERSRVVLSAFRSKYYADRYLTHIPEAEMLPDIMEMQVLKNSSGTAGNILKYMFEGSFFRITPMLEEDLEELANVEIDY